MTAILNAFRNASAAELKIVGTAVAMAKSDPEAGSYSFARPAEVVADRNAAPSFKPGGFDL